ncbi:CDP-alcohol phosphatidyltransferase family protein [Aquiluna sp. KACHI24]|uniref:CDP-alcohol phosphatidyltransferase family protein n=1 Tax=Aquiluna sp. KACHI24 TaxID=2968831 RepID=UPI002208A6C9|nr:CDP-alcohol phosphatidyltransferase family protein [Aquiluna sp. KACHI24]BDQ00158.1 CDP-diacylglycerol--glycerol-3-phosphate 3-phosphatidyltransferase [Aquiluna sp. KACHI24]
MGLSQELRSVPNLLSLLRLLLVPVFLWLLLADYLIWALVILALAGASDWLDGVIARKFNQVTELGKVLDPAADRLYIFATLIGLTINGNIPLWLAVVIIARDVMLLLVYPMLATHGYGPLPVHFLGKAGTFALLYALPLLLMADIWPDADFVILPLAWAFAYWGIALYWVAGFIYVNQVRKLLSK